MKLKNFFLAGVLSMVAVAADVPKGTVPREAAARYPAHGWQDGISVGAQLLSSGAAHKAFATDVDRCCLVVEVALYPARDETLKVSAKDFVLRKTGSDIGVRPSSAQVLAAMLQKKNDAPNEHDIAIQPSVGVGYESGGYDPVTGQRRPGGVVTSTGVGVGIGKPTAPRPASTTADRRTMELELSDKALPEGAQTAPVSGYLYFSIPQGKDRKAAHQLEYTVNGEKIVLPLTSK